MTKQFSCFFIFTVVLITIFITITGSHGIFQLKKIDSELQSLRERNQHLQGKIIAINQQISDVKNDPFVLEKKVREELGLSRQGEIIYIFPQSQ